MWRRPHYYSHRSVKRQGKKEGRNWRWRFWPPKWPFREPKDPYPPVDQKEPTTFERTLKEAAEAIMGELARKWAVADKVLKPRYCQAKAERERAKQICDKELGEEKAALESYREASEKLLDIPSPPLDPRWMLFWLVVIGLGEFPLNAVVFQVLGQGRIETYLIAAFIGIFFPLAAHSLGKSLRQANKTRTDKLLIYCAPLPVLGFLAVIGYFRAKFFEAIGRQHLLGITVSPELGTILFVVINIAVFFVATVISYQGSHEDEARYGTARKAYKHALRVLKKESQEAKAAARRLECADKRFQNAHHRRDTVFRKMREQARSIKELFDCYQMIYRTANLESRPGGGTPACFNQPPAEAAVPPALTNLDWDCREKGPSHTAARADQQTSLEEKA